MLSMPSLALGACKYPCTNIHDFGVYWRFGIPLLDDWMTIRLV